MKPDTTTQRPKTRRLYNNLPTVVHLPRRVRLLPGPEPTEISEDDWQRALRHKSVQSMVRDGSITADSHKPREARRPRKQPPAEANIDIGEVRGRGSRAIRRAEKDLVTPGSPDPDLVAELEGRPTVSALETEAEALRRKVLELEAARDDEAEERAKDAEALRRRVLELEAARDDEAEKRAQDAEALRRKVLELEAQAAKQAEEIEAEKLAAEAEAEALRRRVLELESAEAPNRGDEAPGRGAEAPGGGIEKTHDGGGVVEVAEADTTPETDTALDADATNTQDTPRRRGRKRNAGTTGEE